VNTAAFLFRGQHFQSSTGSDALALTAALKGTQHRCIQGLHCSSEGRDLRGVAAVVVLLFLAGDAALLAVSDFSSEAKHETKKREK